MLLGIDYGTTRTVVAAVDRGNYPVVSFHNESGDTMQWYPSLVAAHSGGGERRFGFDAAARQNEPVWTVLRSFKRELSQHTPESRLTLAQDSVPVIDLLTEFLIQLRRDLFERSNLRLKRSEPLEAMISVPANSNSNQRFITLEAFRRAGFHVKGTINEPSAAGIEYAHHYLNTAGSSRGREHVVVYDLGGGTFDASVISIAERRHEVVSSDGIAHLGGDDFDQLLFELALEQAGVRELTERERFRLLEECREKKEGLHPNTRRLAIDLGQVLEGAGEVIISTAEFYERSRPLVEQTIEAMESAMKKLPAGAELDWRSVAAIYMVGGASDLPIVGRTLRERFSRQVKKSPYPHAATAIGLAIAADTEAGYTLRERFTRHFGVWRESDEGRTVQLDVLFEKDTLLPDSEGGRLTRSRRYQPAHNLGHFRYVECSRIDEDNQPTGDITPWADIYFPFDPRLQNDPQLERFAVTRMPPGDYFVEELYSCDQTGIIEVEMINHANGWRRTFQLHGGGERKRAQATKVSG
ncbi:MAG: Hsp70 family protein [Pyrinomonadaceae bacterium]|nr:Hsp70 family protein [Pyrinomonadaceae bacterium]